MNRVKEFRKELGISQLRASQGYRCLETNHQYD